MLLPTGWYFKKLRRRGERKGYPGGPNSELTLGQERERAARLVKDGGEELSDAVEETVMLRFLFRFHGRGLLDYGIQMHLPLGGFVDWQIGRSLHGRWGRFRGAILRAEDKRRIDLHMNLVGLRGW